MRVLKVVELTIEEAKTALIEFYTNVLMSDKSNTHDLVKFGGLHKLPNFSMISDKEVVDKFGEFDLGREEAEVNSASHVVIKTGDYTWETVFDLANVDPTQRHGTQFPFSM